MAGAARMGSSSKDQISRAGDHVQTHCARRSRAAGLRAACACARAAMFSAAVPGLAIFTKVRSCGV
jgi:hypothetical protein